MKPKYIVEVIKGRIRLLFGFCPKCNSDAPKMYNCNVCNWYQTGLSGMPSKQTKIEWLQRFNKYIEQKRFYEFLRSNKKPFYLDTFRKLLRQYDNDEISISKLVEELNYAVFKKFLN
jgi:hypothetical protein